MDVKGYATLMVKEDLVPHNFARHNLREDGAVIDILYSSIYHLDIHNAHNDWGGAKCPVVPEHEIIGRVMYVGKSVTKFKVGDLTGVSCIIDSCQHCSVCEQGLKQYCEKGNTLTYSDTDRHGGLSTFGGYSDEIAITEKSVVKVPERIDLRGVAPLLCVGITTQSPPCHWQVGEGSKVVVVDLGGFGYMAIKLINVLGVRVTLFTYSPSKEVDARCLGASHVVFSIGSEQMRATANQLDLIIDTAPYVHNLNLYIPTLALSGMLVLADYLGTLDPLLNTAPLILGRRSMAGSVIGSIAETQEMMDLCGQYDITTDVEVIDIQDTNRTWQRILKSDMRYRLVIDTTSLK